MAGLCKEDASKRNGTLVNIINVTSLERYCDDIIGMDAHAVIMQEHSLAMNKIKHVQKRFIDNG